MTQETKDFLAAKKDDGYKIFSDSRFDSLQEYKAMLWILRGDDFELTDFGKLDTNSDFWDPTFAERIKDEFGEEYPGETALTNDHDYLSEQSLDYIFGLKRKSSRESSQDFPIDEQGTGSY